jgi:hypothetical protein
LQFFSQENQNAYIAKAREPKFIFT